MDQSKPLLVAIVEHDAPSRTALGRFLRAAGFEPAHFESAEAHIDTSPEPTCIVVDVQLPGMSASTCRSGSASPAPHRRSSRRRPGHEKVIQERAQQNGCAAFFWKPVDRYTLTATIASITNP